MGSVAGYTWSLVYVVLITLVEFTVFKLLPEALDIRLGLVFAMSLIVAGLIYYKEKTPLLILLSYIGLVFFALIAYLLEFDFYYQGYPENILQFVPNMIFKPAILVSPFIFLMFAAHFIKRLNSH